MPGPRTGTVGTMPTAAGVYWVITMAPALSQALGMD